MKLAYKAVDKSGSVMTDTIEADSTADATTRLRQRGLYVTEIGRDNGTRAPARRKVAKAGQIKNLALWSRQLCVLVRTGTPLAQALAAVERQVSPGPWRDVIEDLYLHVSEGVSLSDAMTKHDHVFDDVTRSLVAAGETTGQLGPMLDRVATLLRQQLKMRRTLVGAMVYPMLLGGVGFVVTLVMLLGVIPRFSDLFESLNAALPPTTEFLLLLSEGLRSYWWALLLVLVGGGVGAKLYFSGPNGKRTLDTLGLRVPYVGPMLKSLATARIARLLGVMLEARVPLLDALKLTQFSTGNTQYDELMTGAIDCAKRGEAISSVFSRSSLINPSVSEAIRHGEENGQIGPILTDMADFLDEENEVIVRTVMSVLEPLILIVLGLAVGFIALSLFIPLFDLAGSAGAQP